MAEASVSLSVNVALVFPSSFNLLSASSFLLRSAVVVKDSLVANLGNCILVFTGDLKYAVIFVLSDQESYDFDATILMPRCGVLVIAGLLRD